MGLELKPGEREQMRGVGQRRGHGAGYRVQGEREQMRGVGQRRGERCCNPGCGPGSGHELLEHACVCIRACGVHAHVHMVTSSWIMGTDVCAHHHVDRR